MKPTTHTPGPWFVRGKSGNDAEAFVIEAKSRTIAWTANTFNDDTGEEVITGEDRANARLIEAAPALLASLENMVGLAAEALALRDDSDDTQDHEMLDVYEAQYKKALAAIRKARGRVRP